MRLDQLEKSSPLDSWLLKAHKKFRIHIPKDDNCLYKAVSEQLYPCQNYYQKVKDKCSAYLATHDGGNLEELSEGNKLLIIAKTYERNVVLFQKEYDSPTLIGKFGGTKMDIMLRLDEDGFYECIKPIEFMKTAAFCQSLIYERLYEHFGISKDEQQAAIAKVRTKVYNYNQKSSMLLGGDSSSSIQENGEKNENSGSTSSAAPIRPPFPFRVAKSLDPSFYRNSQYDIWIDTKKADEQKIKTGDKVLVKQASSESVDVPYVGHVQQVAKDSATAQVYVEKNGEVLEVDASLITKCPTPKKTSTRARKDKGTPSPENERYSRSLQRSQSAPITSHPGLVSSSQVANLVNIPLTPCYPLPPVHPQQAIGHLQTAPITTPVNVRQQAIYHGAPSSVVPSTSYQSVQVGYTRDPKQPINATEFYPQSSQNTLAAQFTSTPMLQQPYHHLPLSPPQYSMVVPPVPQYYSNGTSSAPGYEVSYQQQRACVPDGMNQGVPQASVLMAGHPSQASGLLVVSPPPFPPALPFGVPYEGSYGMINMNVAPSQDQQGRDLPRNDGDTLRYFFNVGVACMSYYMNMNSVPSGFAHDAPSTR